MIPTLDPDVLGQWEGRSEKHLDVIDVSRARAMQATLGENPSLQDGDALPHLWHWLYFSDLAPTDALAPDGLAAPGAIFPPIDLANRMWAGARFEFFSPMIIGQTVERQREVLSVTVKEGRSGLLCFLTLRDSFRADARTLFCEEHDLVYRTPMKGALPHKVEVPYQAQFGEDWSPSAALLFRYSAVTFNSHKIHYDPEYCREVEGYPGLIVHGPLTATMLFDFAKRNAADSISRFRLKATAPLILGQQVRLSGRELNEKLHVWAESVGGELIMDAEADYVA